MVSSVRPLVVAGIALSGAAFWMSATTAGPGESPPKSVSAAVRLVDHSVPLTDQTCTSQWCLVAGVNAAPKNAPP